MRPTQSVESPASRVPVNDRIRSNSKTVLTDQTNFLPFKQILAVFLGLALCITVSALDSVSVATALPTVASAFNAGSVISWVPSAYLLTSTSFQPLYGRFSDIFGRKSALVISMVIFMVGNLLAGFAKNITALIVFRGFAGSGGGGILSLAQIVMSDIVSLRDRGKYQGIIGGFVALGYAVGPVLGGALAQKVSWRWCFWINIPIALCSVVVIIFVLPLKPVQGSMRRKLQVIDYVGTGLTLVGCTLIILPLIWGGVTFPWKSAVVLAPLVSGFLVWFLFCIWEWRWATLPIVPMYIFKHVTVNGVYITMFINGFAFFSSLYYLPQFFQVVLGYSPIHAGISLIPLLVSQMVASWISGILVSRTGRYRTIVHSGFGLWAIACGCTSTITPTSHKSVIVVFMLLAGIGAGQTLQTTTVAAQASVARKDMSVVTAFRNFVRMLGGTLSLAVASTILNNSLTSSMRKINLPESTIARVVDDPTILASPSTIGLDRAVASYILDRGYTNGFRSVFILNAALTAVATVASITMIKHKELTRADEKQLKDQAEERSYPSADEEKGAKPDSTPDSQDECAAGDGTVKGEVQQDSKSTMISADIVDGNTVAAVKT